MAASFNDSLIRELYEWESLELRKTHIDVLLGPGLNIHRNPLNGRNFEYFSEDPLLTGNMAAAQLQGLHKYGTTGCIKHFAGNNQEYRRHYVDSVVSERAVREIYLKPFELAVKNGHADCVMSSYGVLNGIYTASNYDLLTTILRGEWGFNGVVMTDWWAKGAEEGCPGMAENTAQMARAQNDLAMVNQCAETNSRGDNYGKGLELGIVTRAEYQRNAANICRFVMKLPSMDRMLGNKSELDISLESALSAADSELSSPVCIYEENGKASINPSLIRTGRGQNSLFQFFCEPNTSYTLTITCRAPEQSSLAQFSLAVYQDRKFAAVISINGSETKDTSFEIDIEPHFQGNPFIKFHSSHTGLIISGAELNKKQYPV